MVSVAGLALAKLCFKGTRLELLCIDGECWKDELTTPIDLKRA